MIRPHPSLLTDSSSQSDRPRRNIEALPIALIVLRAGAAPALILAELLGAPGIVLAGIVVLAFISDVFDGVIARLLGTVTDVLRGADSLVDTIFYIAAVIALILRSPGVIFANATGIAIVVGLEAVRQVIERIKYGRMAAYHMWSAKLWGITLLLGFLEAFLTGRPGPLFTIAVAMGIVTDIEGLAATLVLSRWHHDVPTIWHAIRIERQTVHPEIPTT